MILLVLFAYLPYAIAIILSAICICLVIMMGSRDRYPILQGVAILALFFLAIPFLLLSPVLIADLGSTEQLLLRSLSTSVILPACFMISVLLYRMRGTKPFFYGLLEIFAGSAVTQAAIASPVADLLTKALALLGGLYIIVRGLDNMEKKLPRRFVNTWNNLFPKERGMVQ